MAICYPDYGEDRSAFESPGEVKFYDACKAALDANYHVFHSVAWIAHTARGEAKDGEADFVICHPDRGILVVEIKGGGVRADFRTGRWTSIDQHGVRHHISNPFRQAARGKFNVIEKLKQHRDWPRLNIRRVIAGHAAFFPDLDDARPLQGPDAPPDIIGDKTDLPILGEWMVSVFQFWSSQEDNQDTGSGGRPLGAKGVELARRLFARVVEVKPLLSAIVAAEETERIRLTNQQVRILDLLARQRRIAVSGGAGTGKTILAREKAQRLASEGFKTLLICYNRPLADFLKSACGQPNGLEIASFHQLCHQWIKRADAQAGRDLLREADHSYPGMDLYEHHMPIALSSTQK